MTTKQRRLDIDLLRCVAIISVIIFHFKRNYLPLGFLGVDLFFVISGYLISKIIKDGLEQGKFTFKNFYLRRARRILPVLLVVLLVTSVVSLFVLLPNDLLRYTKSLLSTLGFFANFYFWNTGGYFGLNDELKPLLHMWSLGVEEQFYLLFPLLFFLLFKYVKKNIIIIILISLGISVSYALNIFFLRIESPDPAFFLFPTRAWEFGVGILIANLPSFKIKRIEYNYLYSLIAFIIIFGSFFVRFEYIPQGTLICLGAALILTKIPNKSFLFEDFIIIKIFKQIGLMSFSLYLWHWPIHSFFQYAYVDIIPFYLTAIGISITFILSYFSWKYIEIPFQKKEYSLSLGKYLIISAAPILICSFLIFNYNGFPNRFSNEYANNLADAVGSNYKCSIKNYRTFGISRACLLKNDTEKASIALIGNSHAQMYGRPYEIALKKNNVSGLIVPLNTCLPTLEFNTSVECLELARKNYSVLMKDKNIETVLIGLTWYTNKLVDFNNNKILDENFFYRKKGIENLIINLKKENKNVYLFGPIAIPKYDFASEASRKIIFSKNKNFKDKIDVETFQNEYNDPIKFFLNKMGKNFIQPHKKLCDNNYCYYSDKGGSFFSDGNHLSKYGSSKMTEYFDLIIKDVFN